MSKDRDLGLVALVASGPNAGLPLYPHRHKDGCFVVSLTRYRKDYVRLSDVSDIPSWLHKGYSLRMSNPERGLTKSSLIRPDSIRILAEE